MEITVALIISILGAVISVSTFVLNRKDKAVQSQKENHQELIEYQLKEIKEDNKEIKNDLKEIRKTLSAYKDTIRSMIKLEIEERIDDLEKKANKQSVAMELLETLKQQNKEQCKQLKSNFNISMILNFVLVILLVISVGYIIYLKNDTSIVETSSIEIEGVEQIDNSHIKIGDDIWEKLQ